MCFRLDDNPGPDSLYVEAVEDTLRHIEKTGAFSLASKWYSTPDLQGGIFVPPFFVNEPSGVNHNALTLSQPSGHQASSSEDSRITVSVKVGGINFLTLVSNKLWEIRTRANKLM